MPPSKVDFVAHNLYSELPSLTCAWPWPEFYLSFSRSKVPWFPSQKFQRQLLIDVRLVGQAVWHRQTVQWIFHFYRWNIKGLRLRQETELVTYIQICISLLFSPSRFHSIHNVTEMCCIYDYSGVVGTWDRNVVDCHTGFTQHYFRRHFGSLCLWNMACVYINACFYWWIPLNLARYLHISVLPMLSFNLLVYRSSAILLRVSQINYS